MNLGFAFDMTDFYCGAGGSSEGADWAGAQVKNAANHWDRAIETHQQNHPHTRHYLVDLLDAHPSQFPYTPLAWFSPECKTHSRGRGRSVLKPPEQLRLWEDVRDPEEERSRVTMEQVVKFTRYHRYQAVIVENVVDIKYWPPLARWFREMESLGYDWHVCYYNSQFFHPLNGLSDFAPQSRDRWYAVFWRRGNRPPDLDFRPWAWCPRCGEDVQAMQVFKKPVFPQGLYDNTGKRGQYYYACPRCQGTEHGRQPGRVEPYYFAAWNCIDWSIPIIRIGDRPQPLRPKTIRRIKIGLEKYGGQPLMVQLTRSHAENDRSAPLTRPMMTQTTRQALAFIVPMKAQPHEMPAYPASQPVSTLTTVGSPAVLLVEMYGNGDCRPPSEPVSTVTAGGAKSGVLLLPPAWVHTYYNRDSNQSGIDGPAPTVVCDNRMALVMPQTPLVTSYYGQGDGVRPCTDALPTVTTLDRHGFILNMQADNDPTSISEPVPTMLTGNHKYLVDPGTIDVDDCGFRMFEPHECMDAQGFPDDYTILGTKREQQKQIGQAVTPPVGEYIVRAVRDTLC